MHLQQSYEHPSVLQLSMGSMPTSVSIQPCSGGKCLVAELDFEMGEAMPAEVSMSSTANYPRKGEIANRIGG
jgi:hypothetical protein